jgi:hypothetical protein
VQAIQVQGIPYAVPGGAQDVGDPNPAPSAVERPVQQDEGAAVIHDILPGAV